MDWPSFTKANSGVGRAKDCLFRRFTMPMHIYLQVKALVQMFLFRLKETPPLAGNSASVTTLINESILFYGNVTITTPLQKPCLHQQRTSKNSFNCELAKNHFTSDELYDCDRLVMKRPHPPRPHSADVHLWIVTE